MKSTLTLLIILLFIQCKSDTETGAGGYTQQSNESTEKIPSPEMDKKHEKSERYNRIANSIKNAFNLYLSDKKNIEESNPIDKIAQNMRTVPAETLAHALMDPKLQTLNKSTRVDKKDYKLTQNSKFSANTIMLVATILGKGASINEEELGATAQKLKKQAIFQLTKEKDSSKLQLIKRLEIIAEELSSF